MKTDFKSLIQLVDFFKDDATCVAYMEQLRWGGTPTCPHCDTPDAYRTARGYKCKNKECYKKFSIISGTPIDNTKIHLRTWFACMYLLSAHKKGISSIQMGKYLNVKQATAWFMMHRLRELMKEVSPEKVGGGGQVVEVDETYVGGKMKNMTHKKRKEIGQKGANNNKHMIMCYVVRGGVLRLEVESDRKKIFEEVLNTVDPESVLITDMSGSYAQAKNHFSAHETVDHANKEYVRDGIIHTNTIEGAFSQFDRMVMGTWHFISRKHMQRYANEAAYKYNTRKMTDVERFAGFIGSFRQGKLTYKSLTFKA